MQIQMANITVPETKPAVCPRCGSDLVHKKGKYGAFIGCTAYPKCDYTEKLS